VRNGALLLQRRDLQLEPRNVSAFQAVKDGTHVEELADLFPPLWSTNQPAKERRVDPSGVCAKQYEVLAKRKFELL
jgi:hypothetical protein